MNRKMAREEAFKLVYQMQLSNFEIGEQLKIYTDEYGEIVDNDSMEFIRSLVLGVVENKDSIYKIIDENANNWSINRMAKVDIAILSIAIYEINYTATPYKVAINEAVELAKKYSEDNAKSFINGILANVIGKEEIKKD